MTNAELRFYMLKYNVFKRQVDQKKVKEDETIVKSKVSEYKNRGFAYSGEAGNDTQVTDKITTRMQEALYKQLFSRGSA